MTLDDDLATLHVYTQLETGGLDAAVATFQSIMERDERERVSCDHEPSTELVLAVLLTAHRLVGGTAGVPYSVWRTIPTQGFGYVAMILNDLPAAAFWFLSSRTGVLTQAAPDGFRSVRFDLPREAARAEARRR